MIERSGIAQFTLQPLIMEYLTDRFVERVSAEIEAEKIDLFGRHALIKAQVKDHVRESQVRLILLPIVQQLLNTLGTKGIEKKLKSILSTMQETQLKTS